MEAKLDVLGGKATSLRLPIRLSRKVTLIHHILAEIHRRCTENMGADEDIEKSQSSSSKTFLEMSSSYTRLAVCLTIYDELLLCRMREWSSSIIMDLYLYIIHINITLT